LSHAGWPLTVAELDAVLQRLSPSGENVPSLEERITSKYASLIKLTRDDGLSNNQCGVDMDNGMFFSAPTSTTVRFAHDTVSEYFQKGLGKFSADQTRIPLGVTTYEAHSTLLRTCLEVYINPGGSGELKSSKTLQDYASGGWLFHMEALSETETGLSTDESISDRSELACLLYRFCHDENIVREWCYDLNSELFTADKAATVVRCIRAWTQSHHGPLPSDFKSWLTSCTANPAEILVPVARANAVSCFQGEWVALPSLLVVTQIKALCDGGDAHDKEAQPQSSVAETLIEAARWFQLDESAHWNRKLAVALRDSEHHTEAIVYFERALEFDPDSVEARGEFATMYDQQGDLIKVIELELENDVILHKHGFNGNDEHGTPASSSSLQNLSRCYSMIADAYQEMGERHMAFKCVHGLDI
jgi:tetratricopeptide (TPR) repeat protein